MSNTAICLCTYERIFTTQYVVDSFLKQNLENFYLVFDNKVNLDFETISTNCFNHRNIFTYTPGDFLINSFNRPIDKNHSWGGHQNPNYFFAHFRMLLFFLKNPTFDYYWFFDDDVSFEGDLKNFLKDYERVDDDFIAVQVFKKEDYPEFPRISKQSNKMTGSGGHWLDRTPGPGDVYKLPMKYHLGSFYPIVRYSNKAMQYLIELNKQNYYGYSEGFVPTMLANGGYKVASMLSEDDKFFIKPSVECKISHKGMEFPWSWL
jgi:hypothetical protein